MPLCLRLSEGEKGEFVLYSLSCENCDERLGKYTCVRSGSQERAGRHDDDDEITRHRRRSSGNSEGLRQELLVLTQVSVPPFPEHCLSQLMTLTTQAVQHFSGAAADLRTLSIKLPRIYSDATRAVWCPRCPRTSHEGFSPSFLGVSGLRLPLCLAVFY